MGSVPKLTKPYRAAMEGKWGEVKSFYERRTEFLQSPLTVNGDTILHIAVYIRNKDLLEAILAILKRQITEFSMFDFDEYQPFQVKDNHGQTALHLAAADGNLEALNLLLKYDEKLLAVANNRGETPLFLAASFGQTKVVKLLSSKIKEKEPHVKRKDQTSILHIAILGQYLDTAVELLKSHDVSPDAEDENDTTGFQLLANMPSAFKSGYQMGKFKKLLYYCLPDVDYADTYDEESDRKSSRNKGDLETGNERENHQPSNQQTAHCPSGFSRVYNTIWRRIAKVFPFIKEVWKDKKKHNKAVELAKILAETDFSWKRGNFGGAPREKSTSILKDFDENFFRLINQGNLGGAPSDKEVDEEDGDQGEKQVKNKLGAPSDKEVDKEDKDQGEKKEIKLGAPSEKEVDKEDGDQGEKQENKSGAPSDHKINTSKENGDEEDDEEGEEAPPTNFQSSFLNETPLLAAGINGILEIVKAILDVYPQAIEHVNGQNENIFHVVAKHRSAEILKYLLSSSKVCISRVNKKINKENGDSILHNAAYLSPSSSRDRPGQALLMQSDLQWFERIKKIVPKYFINHRNKKQRTAQELFTEKHKLLLQEGQEWLRRTAEACTLVAVLIATVAFTCAYTVPGGSSDTGRPLLLKQTPFSVFATSDALSLCFSLTSVVVFLSIMTSKMNEKDFRRSLPFKLVLGLTTLFLSVAFMMVAFSATLLLMIRQKLHWAAIPIYTVACCPVTIFLLLQFPLYLNISLFTLKDLLTSKSFMP